MGVLAVYWYEQVGVGGVVQGQQLVGLTVPGCVHTQLTAVHQTGAASGQCVVEPCHSRLVARDGMRREHHGVAVPYRHEAVAALTH